MNKTSPNPCARIAAKKTKQSLHKPFEDVSAVLEDIRSFNENLFLCCLLTYGCLLRPHREIRQLTWGDFSDDLTFISLSGDRNKSGRNRIVPVTPSVRVHLTPKERHLNIFSDSPTPFNQDYFKTLWGRYKAQSGIIQRDQTLVLIQTHWSHRCVQENGFIDECFSKPWGMRAWL